MKSPADWTEQDRIMMAVTGFAAIRAMPPDADLDQATANVDEVAALTGIDEEVVEAALANLEDEGQVEQGTGELSAREVDAALDQLVSDGLAEVRVNPETGEREYKLTPEGERQIKETVRTDPAMRAFYEEIQREMGNE